MLAEAVHSVADTSNQGLLLLGQREAAKEADALHPLGYGRSRYFWAFVVALVLFSLGSVFECANLLRGERDSTGDGVDFDDNQAYLRVSDTR